MKRIFCAFSLVGLVVGGAVMMNPEGDNFKRHVYSVNLNGIPHVKSVSTLDKPILTPQTISENVKESVLRIETLELGNTPKFVKSIKPLFVDSFYEQMSADLNSRSDYYVENLVRVVDFIVTKQPVYIGSRMGKVRNWTFYLEGVYGLKGFGTINTTGTKRIFITVEESTSVDGNPMGVKISRYKYV